MTALLIFCDLYACRFTDETNDAYGWIHVPYMIKEGEGAGWQFMNEKL